MTVQTEPRNQQPDRQSADEPDADTSVQSQADAPSQEEPDLPLDVVFDLLSNERRRRVLRFLLHESDETTLGELAEHIASIENDKPVRELSSSERKRVYICLYQCHLPKLDDANVLDFDEHRKSVLVGDKLDQVTTFLSTDAEDGMDEKQHSLSLVALAPVVAVLLVAQTQFLPSGLLSGGLIGLFLGTAAVMAVERLDGPLSVRQPAE